MTLKTKIYGLVTLLTCGLAAGFGFLFIQMDRIARQDADLAAQQLQVQNDTRLVQLTFKKQVQAWKDILLRGSDPAALQKYREEFFQLEADVQRRSQSLRQQITEPTIQESLAKFTAAHSELGKQYRASLALFEQSGGRDFASADRQVKGKDRPPTDAIDSIVVKLASQTEADQQSRARELRVVLRITAACAAILTMGLLFFGIYVARSIAKSTATLLKHLAEHAEAMREGHGDLTNLVPASGSDEFAAIAGSFNTFILTVGDMMTKLSRHSECLASASEEISAGTKVSSEASRSQAEQTQQASAAIQEMSTTGQEISQHSKEAAEASRLAAESAREGGKIIRDTLSTMHHIADSTRNTVARITELGKNSEQIGKIVAVIDDIADQTNLLALNAAIEAARAGEQGRGFAVVADEVRKLAERTTSATKEIAMMIQSIQAGTHNAVQAMELGSRDVDVGVRKTAASGSTLQELIQRGDELGNMVSQIATAVASQSAATEQMSANVSQIASSIQESATAATQTAKACSDLSAIASDLRCMVSNFKLRGEVGQSAPQVPVAAAYRTGGAGALA